MHAGATGRSENQQIEELQKEWTQPRWDVCEVSQQLEEPFGRHGVERPSWLVGKEDVLPAGQCPRNPDALPLATRDLAGIERLATQIEAVVQAVPGTTSAFAERITGGFYLDISMSPLFL